MKYSIHSNKYGDQSDYEIFKVVLTKSDKSFELWDQQKAYKKIFQVALKNNLDQKSIIEMTYLREDNLNTK